MNEEKHTELAHGGNFSGNGPGTRCARGGSSDSALISSRNNPRYDLDIRELKRCEIATPEIYSSNSELTSERPCHNGRHRRSGSKRTQSASVAIRNA